ncbi:MAG TPA: hypothetical protein VF021_03835 [Longimicrobiales bacterium]
MKPRAAVLVGAALLIGCAPLLAQAPASCSVTMTVRECANKTRGITANDGAEDELQKKPAGVSLPGARNVSIQDFIPRLASALYAPGLQSIDSLGTTINIPLATMAPATLQLGVILFKPVVFAPLLDAAPGRKRDSIRTRLEDRLGELDQPRITAALNLENAQWGRRFSANANDVSRVLGDIDALVEAKLREQGLLQDADFLVLLARRRRAGFATHDPKCTGIDLMDATIGCFTGAAQDSLLIDIGRLAGIDTAAAMTKRLYDAYDVARFADLVNNQPQLIFNVQYDALQWMVGPQQAQLQLRFETGAANMRGLRSHCRGTVRLSCFRSYLAQDAVQAGLRENGRFVFAFDAVYQPDYRPKLLAADSTSFALPASWKWEGSFGYGRYLNAGRRGPQDTRIDVVARGTRQKKDGVREPERLTAAATVTQRVSDALTAAIALNWANKPEFLDADTKKLGASVGVRFKTLKTPRD